MEKLNEVYVVTDGESYFDNEGHMYCLTNSTLEILGFTEEYANKVCEGLIKYGVSDLLKVAKVELFAKVSY